MRKAKLDAHCFIIRKGGSAGIWILDLSQIFSGCSSTSKWEATERET